MILLKDEINNNVIIRCDGRLDAVTSPQVENMLNNVLSEKKYNICIDFNKIDYLSSAGMRLLLSMTKRVKILGGRFVLFSINEDVMEIIKMAGFEHILNIYSDEKQAVIDI